MRVSLQQKSGKTGMENIAAVRIPDHPLGAAAGATLSRTTVAHGKLTAPWPAHPIKAGIHAAPPEGWQWANLSQKIVVDHETFPGFLRLYR